MQARRVVHAWWIAGYTTEQPPRDRCAEYRHEAVGVGEVPPTATSLMGDVAVGGTSPTATSPAEIAHTSPALTWVLWASYKTKKTTIPNSTPRHER
jgi:hypothetical protein